jgi:hypothetical protein
VRDKKHLNFIRSLPCLICGVFGSEAAHLRKGTDGGIGLKPSDKFTTPLCHNCHAEQHRVGELRFWQDIDKVKEFCNSIYKVTGNKKEGLKIVRYYQCIFSRIRK